MSAWKKVATTDEFQTADRKLADLGDGRLIGLFKIGEDYYAVDAWCSHQRASLMHGDLEGYEIICPVHGARFDVRTGRHLSLPAVRPIRRYNVRVQGSDIEIEI
jgi:3-phenylpropionate/trans-cinnamate dioxygenase ferredoxin subunit